MTLLAGVDSRTNPLRVGIGGPVGSGKTALVEALCKRLRDHYDIFVITNDIYTKEDQLILTRAEALPAERIMGVETGGCPHTAIREDASMNLAAIEVMSQKFPHAELCFIESGGDNLAATFSPELADLTISSPAFAMQAGVRQADRRCFRSQPILAHKNRVLADPRSLA